MRRLTIVAHWDPRGGAAPHFLRQLDQLTTISEEVVVASPSPLTTEAVQAIEARATLLRRPNYGHDFGSWRDALEQRDWAQGYDELLLTNDSYVGFFRPIELIIDEMSRKPVEVWGMTKADRHAEHIQSYFLMFTSAALHSQAFMRFWTSATPATSRTAAILQQEVGVSRAMREAGFALGTAFEPTLRERRRANARGAYWLWRRQSQFPEKFDGPRDAFFSIRRIGNPDESDRLNWSSAFADSSLDHGRLPVIKFDVFRYDPYYLGAGGLLSALERTYPEQMAGVRDYLEETKEMYPPRPFENYGFARPGALLRPLIGYRTRPSRGANGVAAS
jgi:rhamnosyltransferase